MATYEAQITWQRQGAPFADGRYSRGHEWLFDGGVTIPASASPSHVPAPYSVAAAVDPEEALVAAAASCHMLMFLFLAAKRRLIVDSYVDDASGVVETNGEGRLAFSQITLRPRIQFTRDAAPSAEEISALHHAAHDGCYVANSLKCNVVVAPAAVEV